MTVLKRQDVYVLLGLLARREEEWTFDALSQELGLSASQVHRSLMRAEVGHLFDRGSRRVRRRELVEFLCHGVRYAFPARAGSQTRGVVTCWRAPDLESIILTSDVRDIFVWPDPAGTARGQALEPLHRSVSFAVSRNTSLHQFLALVDVLRVGTARERSVAEELLEDRLL